jgi:acetoin utilization deacetylase AcuC-like enzyme
MTKIGIVKDPIYIEHDPGSYHPESPQRLVSVYNMLQGKDMENLFEEISPRKAQREEIELIHKSSYFDRVAATGGLSSSYLDPDTVTSKRSFEAALYAAGGLLTGLDRIMISNFKDIFALVRPPGHHAESDRGMGFCLFNNIAVAAMYAIQNHEVERILIVDWDLHHGNGTQHSFYSEDRVLYFSTHQFPYYPGTGSFDEVGQGKGRGFTVNVPLGIGHGNEEYYKIFKTLLEPIADIYKPQLVFISAGFDIYYRDPLGGMEVTPEGFAALAQVLKSIAVKHAEGKLLITLEGGYHLEGLTESIASVIKQLSGAQSMDTGMTEKNVDETGKMADWTIERVISVQREFWSCF